MMNDDIRMRLSFESLEIIVFETAISRVSDFRTY